MNDTQKTFDIQVTVKATLTQENIDDIMVSALEGGICYWASKAVVVGKYLGEYASDQISRGGEIEIWSYEPIDNGKDCHVLSLEKFLNGFKLWLANGGDCYDAVDHYDGSVDCGEIDGGCADEIIQYALFGEVIFG